MMKSTLFAGWTLALLSTLNLPLSTLFAQGTAFTYQGRLTDGGNPARGIYDLQFTIYDAATNGSAMGGPITNAATSVNDGLFTVALDFGATVFNGAERWLDIGVRSNGSAYPCQPLTPRQPLTATPYAVRAASFSGAISDGQLSANMARLDGNQTFGGSVNFSNVSGNFTGSFAGKGLNLSNLNASALSQGTVPDARLSTNVATAGALGGKVSRSGDTMTGALTLPPNGLSVGNNQLNAAANRVGIRTATPGGPLEVLVHAGETVDQQQTAASGALTHYNPWQSFTPAVSGKLYRIELLDRTASAWTATLSIYLGEGIGGTLISRQMVARAGGTLGSVTLGQPVPLSAGTLYTFQVSGYLNLDLSPGNPYAGGRSDADPALDYYFRTYMLTNGDVSGFLVSEFGNVGIGTSSPTSALHVNGTVTASAMLGGSVGIGTNSSAAPLHVSSSTFPSAIIDGTSPAGTWMDLHNSSSGGTHWLLISTGSGNGEGAGKLLFNRGASPSTAGGNSLTLQPDGNVGIGTTSPGFKLEVNGSAAKPGGGSWSVASDERLKKNVHPLAGALDKLLALHGVSFEYIDPEKIHELSGCRMGLLAQEVENVFPDWVETGADGYKRVTVRGLEALVVEALRQLRQEQAAQGKECEMEIRRLNQKLQEELNQRDSENAEMKHRLEALEKIIHAQE